MTEGGNDRSEAEESVSLSTPNNPVRVKKLKVESDSFAMSLPTLLLYTNFKMI
jgi:hypothetical protein